MPVMQRAAPFPLTPDLLSRDLGAVLSAHHTAFPVPRHLLELASHWKDPGDLSCSHPSAAEGDVVASVRSASL